MTLLLNFPCPFLAFIREILSVESIVVSLFIVFVILSSNLNLSYGVFEAVNLRVKI